MQHPTQPQDHLVAPPADSAGHRGSQTLPSDVRVPTRTPTEHVTTNQDRNPLREDRPGASSWWIVLGVVLVVMFIGWWFRFI